MRNALKSFFAIFILIIHTLTTQAQEVDGEVSDSLIFPIEGQTGGLHLDNQIEYDVVYDAVNDRYILWPKIGDYEVSQPIYLTKQEYLDLALGQNIKNYYKEKSQSYDNMYRSSIYGDQKDENGSIIPSFKIKSRVFETIFGGNEIQLIPQGFAQLDLGLFIQKIDNPQLLPQNRNTITVDLRQRIQLSILGKIGENLQLKANYDTQAGFGFENQMKLQWKNLQEGGEDDIIQNIELGNISMPLNTSLITGAQSLFGVRTDLRFGKTDISMVFSEQRSESKNITVQGDGVVSTFKVFAENYEYNRNFFLAHYFRDGYDQALVNYPQISSDINITRLEVWRIDRGGNNQESRRSVLALRDLGETGTVPTNGTLYTNVAGQAGIREVSTARNVMTGFNYNGEQYQEGEQYAINENLRKLNESEYTFYPSLGYISLSQPIIDGEDMLAISFQYTRNSAPGQVFKVGEMSDEQENLLIAKLIKPNTTVNVTSPMWDLMMKNIYSLNALSIDQQDFLLNIEFKDNGENSSGTINYLPNTNVSNQSLLQVMNMDRLNLNGDLQASGNGLYGDGIFDYVPNVTIDPQRGTIIFTTVEPFGEHLANKLQDANSPYVFSELYNSLPNTLGSDRLSQRYSLTGRYKGQGGDGIPLGAFNVPQGSVKVTANGIELIEGVDYVVDYELGRVTILNQQLKNSGVPINVSLENQSTFNLQKKRFVGLNVEHKFSDKLLVGGTILNYQERPVTQKAQYGAEPVNNTIVGVNAQYNGESEMLTRLTNKIPGIKTDAISQINIQAEGAYLLPGTNKATNNQSYIDDFEDAQSRISLMDVGSWKLGSTPGKPAGLAGSAHPYFPNGTANNDLSYGNGRKQLAWYTIDPRFYGIGGGAPSGITDTSLSQHRVRRVELRELFDRRDALAGTAAYISTFDLTFYPNDRGPYNVNPNDITTRSWGSVMRPISTPNFVDANVEYVEFWMMDPYADGVGGNGELLLQLGNVSEDVLKDGEMLYENGLPYDGNGAATSNSNWGTQPQNYPIVYAYETEGESRKQQDLGYNGLTDAEEQAAYGLTENNPITGALDPAADNYLFYLDERWDATPQAESVLERYKYFRGTQGNNSADNLLNSSSVIPDAEDTNNDYNLDQSELYNQYTININPSELQNNTNNFIVATKTVNVTLPNGQNSQVTWYQFRVPVDAFDLDIDGDGVDDLVNDDQIAAANSVLTSARYMRMVMRGFDEETTLRFGTMDLVRSNWRRYPKNIYPNNAGSGAEEGTIIDENLSDLEIGEVNLEQNSNNEPSYVLPPGIVREQTQGTTGIQSQNEASMVLKTKLTSQSPTKAVFKQTNLDMRRYKKMEMFVHAEDLLNVTSQDYDNTTKLFLRMGSDFSDNYYEYEIPLKYTQKSAKTPTDIWPAENTINILTEFFVEAKKARDLDEAVSTLQRYLFIPDEENPDKNIYVKGRPSLGNVSSIMIGLRSTSSQDKEVLVWVNELRLSEIDNEGGYAATANVGFTLGDFAQVQVSGSMSSVGFGAIDAGPSQRNQDNHKEYALNAQVKLDKFLPKEWGVELPFNFTISEQFTDPKYNPLDNDVIFEEAPNKQELEKIVRTYTQQKSYGFSNIRKVKTNNKPSRFHDISNFSLSLLYADTYYRDVYTQYNLSKTLNASLNYNYTFKPKYYEPFKNWRAVQDSMQSSKYLQWIKEVNINPLPTRFSFRTEIARTYSERQYRDLNQYLGGNASQFPVAFSNNFLFSWQYNLGFDLTRSLRLDITSSTRTLNDGADYQYANKGMIWTNILDVGRPVNYDQQIQLNYKIPIHLFPYMDWVGLEMGFTSNYNWQARSSVFRYAETEGGEGLGNIAQNSNTISLIGNFDFPKLYREFTGYKKMDSIRRGRQREIDSLSRAFEEQALSKQRKKKNKKAYKFKNKYRAKDYLWMTLASLKRANFNYNQNNGAVLPGILYQPNFFGVGKNDGAPGLGFMTGTQFDIRRRAVERGWVTGSESLLEPYQIIRGTNFTANAQLEPMPNLRVDLNAKRASTYRSSQIGYNLGLNTYNDVLTTLNSSNISLSTSFMDSEELYQSIIENTKVFSQRLGLANGSAPTTNGYYDGYSLSNTDVLVPAFIAAVEGKDANNANTGHNRKIPLPNWNVVYTGLTNIPFINKTFSQVEVSHSYLSSYTANGVQSNANYYADLGGRDGNNNFYTKNIFSTVSMVESFSPLIGVSLTFRNSMQLRAQFIKDRMLTMSLSNYTLNEDYGTEYVVGFGYIIKDLKFKMRYKSKQRTIKGDLNIRADVSLRDNETRIRRILENDSQVTGGQRIMSIMFSADYDLSKYLNIKFYWDQMMSEYKVSTAFPISTIRAGLSATFTFGN